MLITECIARPCSLMPAVIQKLRCNCQLKCQQAPLSDKIANPPYAIHNFGWKEGITNNDEKRDKLLEGNLTAHLDTKGISVTASTSGLGRLQAHACTYDFIFCT